EHDPAAHRPGVDRRRPRSGVRSAPPDELEREHARHCPPMRTIPDHTRRSSGPLTHARGCRTPQLRVIEPRPALPRAYEGVLSSLHLQNGTRPLKSLLLTSAQPEEGKTTVAVGLALALVRAGKRVLLVDADLRRPALHRVFGLENDNGLAEVLAGDFASTA